MSLQSDAQQSSAHQATADQFAADDTVHIVHYLWGFHTGGLENGVVNLINQLPQQRFRHTIVTQCGYDPVFFQRITHPNCSIVDLAKQPGHDLALHWRLYRLLRQLKPDVFHSRNLSAMEGHLAACLARVPLRIHGEHGWDMTDLGGSNVRYQKLRRLLKPLVHHFIALSSEAEQYLLKTIQVAPAKVSRICNGVDVRRFDQPTAASGLVDRPEDCLVFGTVGRLVSVKNQQLLISALALLLAQYPQQAARIRLLLIGDGALRQELEQQAKAMGLADIVYFAGNRSDVPATMALMDVFVLPSLAEGISNTILEAMAAGLPVIASDVGGNPELLPTELCASHLFPSNDAAALCQRMALYVREPKLLAAHSSLVKKHWQNQFSLATMVSRYQAVYLLKNSLLNRHLLKTKD